LLLAIAVSGASAQSVTFIQITDAHIFDSDAKETAMRGYAAQLDNNGSLGWAILSINKLVASGKRIDFVVFTGDFGLEKTDCGGNKVSNPIHCADAITRATTYFRAALVKKILIVPGNNDVPGEDPGEQALAAYDVFVQGVSGELKSLRPPSGESPPDLIDLQKQNELVNGICILGLDSSTFKNTNPKGKPGDRSETNRNHQEKILQALGKSLQDCHPGIVVTHVPNLEDPFRENGIIKRAWNLDPSPAKMWQDLITNSDLLAVFAGHFHDPRRNIYMHDYSWASQPPGRVEGEKTWIAPPLAVKFQSRAKPQARGLLVATVTAAGAVTAVPMWFEFADAGGPADKSDKLAEARAYEQNEEYDKAAKAYQQGLSSKDDWVRAQSEAGFQRTVELAQQHGWKETLAVKFFKRWWWDILFGLTLLLLLFVLLIWPRIFFLRIRRWRIQSWEIGQSLYDLIGRRTVTLIPARKGNENAPVDEFNVQLLLAIEDIHATLQPFGRERLVRLRDAIIAAPATETDLPELKVSGVELKAILAWLKWAHDLLRIRIEIQVWGSNAKAQVVAVQRFAWFEENRWVVPLPGGDDANIVEAAKQLAYDILGQENIR
jgi:3',5'-cyclic AMP phosphodiesterase CpdA